MKPFHLPLCGVMILAALGSSASDAGQLIPESAAQQQGLTRSWFSQVQLDATRHRVERAILADDQLLVLTTSGTLQAFDAETGLTQWTTRVGNPKRVSLGPAVGEKHVAVVNSTTIFILDRADGRELKTFRTAGGVAASPAISKGYVYVPLFNGRLEGFPLAEERLTPWHYTSSGRLFQPPVRASKSVVWANDRGQLYGADASESGTRFWFEGGSPFVAPPTTLGDKVYAATIDGYVFAIDEEKGRRTWRYSAGSKVVNSPVAIGDVVYVATDEPALHAIDQMTGKIRWITGGVSEFIAASEKRLYGLDIDGGLMVLDRETGSPLSRVASRGEHTPVLNQQSDRLYIFCDEGLLQCFHEIGADEPYLHKPIVRAEPEQPKAPEKKEPVKEAAPEEPADDPFGGGDDPFDGDDDPFGSDDGDDAEGDDPFADPFN